MKDYNKNGFQTAFKKAVPNFNETICHFEFKSRGSEVIVVIIWKGVLWKLKIHKSQYYIDLWKNHFIDFFKTGEFDYNAYWKIYKGNGKFIEEAIYKIPLCKKFGNDFYEHSPELDKLFKKKKNDYGIKTVPKPLTNENVIIL